MYSKNIFFIFLFVFFSFFTGAKEKTYYEVLGVSPNAAQEEIKRAYRKSSSKWHPDRQKPEDKKKAGEKMAEINKAYETLKDPQKRQRYDQFGHQNWTSASQKEERDFYSEVFNDIFNRTDRVSKKPVSQKSLHLFKRLILLEELKTNTEIDFNKRDSLLRQLLAEFDIVSFTSAGLNKQKRDKKVRERILQNTSSYIHEVKNIISSNETASIKEEGLKQSLIKFVTEVENRYMLEEITTKERQAIELFYQFSFFNQRLNEFLEKSERKLELLKLERENKLTDRDRADLNDLLKEERKDLRVFRKILSALGLPGSTHHELLLRSYLDALKNSLFQERSGKLLTHNSRLAHQSFYMEEREIIKALRNIKSTFDAIHYENLKNMANPFKLNFLKNFPSQFIVFQAVIGASLYRQSLTDPRFYGADRNPELLPETMKHFLTPSGVVSFFIFVAVAQQMGYRIYGGGRWLDNKSFKSPNGKMALNGRMARTIAPGAGLGLGFFVSSVFDELLRDPHLGKCVKTMFLQQDLYETAVRDSATACEKFYNNWSQGEKWKHYGVDIATLIGSGILSHRFISSILYGIRLIPAGSNLLIGLTKTIGLRAVGWAGFFIHMYFFMEFHKALDKYVGHPLKEQLSAGGVKNNLVELSQRLNQDIDMLPSFSQLAENDKLQELFSGRLKSIAGNIKTLGAKFKGWADTAGMYYVQSASLWRQQTDKLLKPYEASSQLLKDMFILSQLNYNSDSLLENQAWDSDRQINEETKDLWIRLNSSLGFNADEQIKEKYCPQVDEGFLYWSKFCELDEYSSKMFAEEFKTGMFVGAARLIYDYLQSISLNNKHELNPANYVSLDNNELFSSEPKYSIKQTDYQLDETLALRTENGMDNNKKIELSRMLIKKGLDWENSLSDLSSRQVLQLKANRCAQLFPNYQTNEDARLGYDYCYEPSAYITEIKEVCQDWNLERNPDFYESCIDFFTSEDDLKRKWAFKLLSAGVYLLKDIISDLAKKSYTYYYNENNNYQTDVNRIESFQPILDLLRAMEVYKKGEQKFIQSKEMFIYHKKQLESREEKKYFTEQFKLSNPYTLLKNMICGSENKEELLFHSKKFFNSDLSVYYNSQYQSIDKVCKAVPNARIHSFLFDMPAKLKGKKHENLYLALEKLLRGYFSTQELELAFKKLSQDQFETMSGKISQDLDLITENYYKQVISTESPVQAASSLEDFSNYYHKQRILWNIRSFTGGLKGLEISIFQVNYWLETLKKLLLAGEQTQLNNAFDKELAGKEFRFDQESFEAMQLEILSLLQSYNDTFKNDQDSYLIFPDKEILEEIKSDEANESGLSLLDKLKQKYPYSEKPLMLSSDIILSHVLTYSTNNYSYSAVVLIESGQILNSDLLKMMLEDSKKSDVTVSPDRVIQIEWQNLIDSIFIELNKSFQNFFNQLMPLQLKENFENQVFDLQENLLIRQAQQQQSRSQAL